MSNKSPTKIVVVGDGGCGKTSLLLRKVQKTFTTEYIPTIFENHVSSVIFPGSKKTYDITLWDTAGQEDYDRLRPLSYPETDVVLLTFSIDEPLSFENMINKWYQEVRHFCPDIPYIVVGLKSDIRDITGLEGTSLVNQENAQKVSEKIGAFEYIECSAMTNKNVSAVFEAAVSSTRKKKSFASRIASGIANVFTFKACR